MLKKTLKIGMLAASLVVFLFCGSIYAADYDHQITEQKITFSWKIDGANIRVKLSAPTKGWVGVGFNPSNEMKDARFVLGYVKDGKAVLTDQFGTGNTQHEEVEKIGGKNEVTTIGGKEEGEMTTIEFSMPLAPADGKGKKIDPSASTVVLLAYGPDVDTFRLKHKFRTSITVNLATGKSK